VRTGEWHGTKQKRKLEEAVVAMLNQRNIEEAARSVGISKCVLEGTLPANATGALIGGEAIAPAPNVGGNEVFVSFQGCCGFSRERSPILVESDQRFHPRRSPSERSDAGFLIFR
jgi:hypothetical protein